MKLLSWCCRGQVWWANFNYTPYGNECFPSWLHAGMQPAWLIPFRKTFNLIKLGYDLVLKLSQRSASLEDYLKEIGHDNPACDRSGLKLVGWKGSKVVPLWGQLGRQCYIFQLASCWKKGLNKRSLKLVTSLTSLRDYFLTYQLMKCHSHISSKACDPMWGPTQYGRPSFWEPF